MTIQQRIRKRRRLFAWRKLHDAKMRADAEKVRQELERIERLRDENRKLGR